MDQYVINIRKSNSRKHADLIFGFLKATLDGVETVSAKNATRYNSLENAENAAASFVLTHPEYMNRVQVRKLEDYMKSPVRRYR